MSPPFFACDLDWARHCSGRKSRLKFRAVLISQTMPGVPLTSVPCLPAPTDSAFGQPLSRRYFSANAFCSARPRGSLMGGLPFSDDAVEGHRHGVLEPGFGVEAGADLVELREVGAGDGEGPVIGLEPAGGGVGGHGAIPIRASAIRCRHADSSAHSHTCSA